MKYSVQIIRSQRANEREGYTHPQVEKHVGDYESLEEATVVYNTQKTGTEIDKQLVDNETGEAVLTTY